MSRSPGPRRCGTLTLMFLLWGTLCAAQIPSLASPATGAPHVQQVVVQNMTDPTPTPEPTPQPNGPGNGGGGCCGGL